MKVRTKAWLSAAALGVIGGVLVIRYSSVWVAVGFFLMMWGNNLERSSRRVTESESEQ